MDYRVVLVDDDEGITELLSSFLVKEGFSVRAYTDSVEAYEALETEQTDLLLLDVMMPEMDGFTFLSKLRERSSLPVLMLTARGGLDDRLKGLERGADDYLPKPFDPRELVARMHSILRRSGAQDQPQLRFDGLEIDREHHRVALDALPVSLSEMEYTILNMLVDSAVPLSRDALSEQLRGVDMAAFERSIDVSVSRLRKKLGEDSRAPRFIKTVYGEGYLFIGGSRG